MYPKYNVKRGLRDLDGNGVVTGLTEISCIKAKEKAWREEKIDSIDCEIHAGKYKILCDGNYAGMRETCRKIDFKRKNEI